MPIWAAYLPKLLLELGLLLVFLSYFGLPTLNNYLEGKVLTVGAEQLIKMMMIVIILEGADRGKQDGERRSACSGGHPLWERCQYRALEGINDYHDYDYQDESDDDEYNDTGRWRVGWRPPWRAARQRRMFLIA